MPNAPADEYRARLSARRATHAQLSYTDERVSYLRLAVFAVAVLVAVAAWRGAATAWWMTVPAAGFLLLVVWHDRVVRAPDAATLAMAAIAAISLWIATGDPTAFLVVVMLEIVFSVPLRERITRSLHGAAGAARDLDVRAVVLARLERETFAADRLVALQRTLVQ